MNKIKELTDEEVGEVWEEIKNDRTYYRVNLEGKEYYVISNFVPPNQFAAKKQKSNQKIKEIEEEIKGYQVVVEQMSQELESILSTILSRKNYAENVQQNLKSTKQAVNLQERIQEFNNEIINKKQQIEELNRAISDNRNKLLEFFCEEEGKKIVISATGRAINEVTIEKSNITEMMRKDFYSKREKGEDFYKQISIQKRQQNTDKKTSKIEEAIFPDVITYHCRMARKNGERVIVTTGYHNEKQLHQRVPSSIKILLDKDSQNIQEYTIRVEEGKYKIVEKNGKERLFNLAMYEKKYNISLQPHIEELKRYVNTSQINIKEILGAKDMEAYNMVKIKEEKEQIRER